LVWRHLTVMLAVTAAAAQPVRADAGDEQIWQAHQDRLERIGILLVRANASWCVGSADPRCPQGFILRRSGQAALVNDDGRVEVAVTLLAEAASDDEAAMMVAHEIAHILLDHDRRIDAAGRNWNTVRLGEREADRLTPWLMANAGYDPAAAPRFMGIWGPRHGGGMTRAPTHDHWRKRQAAMAEEVAEIERQRALLPGGTLDWRRRFPAVGPLQRP